MNLMKMKDVICVQGMILKKIKNGNKKWYGRMHKEKKLAEPMAAELVLRSTGSRVCSRGVWSTSTEGLAFTLPYTCRSLS